MYNDGEKIFYETVVAIGAHLAMADGNAETKELLELKRYISIDPKKLPSAGMIYSSELKEPRPVRQLVARFRNLSNPPLEMRESLFMGFVSIRGGWGNSP